MHPFAHECFLSTVFSLTFSHKLREYEMIYFFDIHESKECNSRPPYEYILENYFSYFSTKTYVFGYSKEPSH